ncbi:MAG: hypothetical protein HY664_06550 [Chloroflexi bacterium]|nr:hypothetical protein [Chloroflexota bacterium]
MGRRVVWRINQGLRTRHWLAVLIVGLVFIYTAYPIWGGVSASASPNQRFGLAFVNGMGYSVSELRYQQAVDSGATWTRWPLYWSEVETCNGCLDDSAYAAADDVVNRDVAHGLNINAILLGTPSWTGPSGSMEIPPPRVGIRNIILPSGEISAQIGGSSASSPPPNLYTPVFIDGTINPNNYWARFVYTTVSRYKDRVKVWEMWNEPDLKDGSGQGVFWTGSREDYYRLLQVGYLAARAADPSATVLFAGLAYWTDTDFFPYVLNLMKNDGSASANQYYFNVLPLHFYSDPHNLYDKPLWFRSQMVSYLGSAKPVWVNETNIPVCDDTQVGDPFCPSPWRGTMEEQAAYIIQAYALALAAGVERVFIFQHYDDNVGYREYFGLVRNNTNPRPAYTSYQVAAQYFLNPTSAVRGLQGNVETVTILYGSSPRRVTVMWNNSTSPAQAQIAAVTPTAILVNKYGAQQSTTPQGGFYQVPLPAATNPEVGVGGDPYLLVETIDFGYKIHLPRILKGASD